MLADSARRSEELRRLLARALPSQTPAERLWSGFRETFPYHLQVLALSAAASDGTRTLIASEPPPNVSLEDVLLATKDVLRGHAVREQPVGYDGWVRDVVLSVGGTEEDLSAAVSRLTRLFYGTTYKAYVLPLPARRSTGNYPMNLDVTSTELQQWVRNPDARFSPVDVGPVRSANEVLDGRESAVYAMSPAPLVAWWIPSGLTIDRCAVQAREFALDADIVVGAIADSRGTLVLGRRRIVPVDVLPPLRFETIRLLAHANTGPDGELAQSFERNHRFAGRFDAHRDWAPIYLSEELIDTEYGSLLNITDQILKSWSNNGKTRYERFTSYPNPDRWPFAKPLYEEARLTSVRYNWNTGGAAYTVERDGQRVFALGHSGALPVSYFPEGSAASGPDAHDASARAKRAEDSAYQYFGERNDPNLVRVVQYATLYQVFSAFQSSRSDAPQSREHEISPVLDRMLDSLEAEVGASSDAELEELARRVVMARGGLRSVEAGYFEDLRSLQAGTYLGPIDPETTRWARHAPESELREEARRVAPELMGQHIEMFRDELRLIRSGTPPREIGARRAVLSAFAGLRKVPERYVRAVAAQSNTRWIHTPAVVVSYNTRVSLVGGHSLGAKVTRIQVSGDVPSGQVRLSETGDLLVNPADAPRASQLAWRAARSGDSRETLLRELNRAVSATTSRAPRRPELALQLQGIQPGARTAHMASGVTPPPISARSIGWHRAPRPGRSPSVPADLLVERTGREYAITFDQVTYTAFTAEDATDIVLLLARRRAADNGVRMELRGFARHEGEAFTRSARVRAADEGSPAEISALVSGDEAALARMNSRRLNFRDAKVSASEVVETAHGPQGTIRIDVPAATGGQGGTATVRLQFRQGASRRVIDAVMRRVSEVLTRLFRELGNTVDALTFNFRLNAELKAISREFGVDIRVDHEFRAGASDLYFAHAPEQRAPNDSEPAGSLLAE
jgi:hypothetical protein